MADRLTDQQLRDFAAGLRDDLEGAVLADDANLERLAAIWAEDDYDIDVLDPVITAVKMSEFAAEAIGFATTTFLRIGSGLNAYATGRTNRP
jgi:hypothetical protein